MMLKPFALVASILVTSLGFAASVQGASEGPKPPSLEWSFGGPFGRFDDAQLQRGFKVYREVCAACHGLSRVAFRNLSEPGGPGFSPAQIQALAAEYKIKDGPNDAGEMFERAGRPADRIPSPFPNTQAAAAANNGKAPPDLSVMAKARTYERGFPWFVLDIFTQYHEVLGPNYVAAFLKGYDEPPAGFVVPAGGNYNTYYPGHVVAMPNVLSDGLVEYPKDANGVPSAPETRIQYAKDVTAFLMWTAEPYLEQRKKIAFFFISALIVLAGLLYFTKKKIWARVGQEADA
jgi:ubiquinol-cytochrome c reductase cytochrome c1 subunit